jgi:TDG/mug DNA glycosylase family protein
MPWGLELVGPDMRVLVCGLNPSLHAARTGIPYSRPGNRFWPAALAAGLVTKDRDPVHALKIDHVGWTDLVARPTAGAAELAKEEFVAGARHLTKVVRRYQPRVVCFVGLTGYRVAVDKAATAGPCLFAGRAAYLMPSTSGRNAHVTVDELVGHMKNVSAMGFRE